MTPVAIGHFVQGDQAAIDQQVQRVGIVALIEQQLAGRQLLPVQRGGQRLQRLAADAGEQRQRGQALSQAAMLGVFALAPERSHADIIPTRGVDAECNKTAALNYAAIGVIFRQ